MFLTLESRIRSAALERLPSLWALLMFATLLPLQAEAVPPETQGCVKYLSVFNQSNWAGFAPSLTVSTAATQLLPLNLQQTRHHLTCYGVGGCRASGGASRADHTGIAATGSTDTTRAGTAVAAPLPALPGAAGSLPRAVLSDVVTHLMTLYKWKNTLLFTLLYCRLQSLLLWFTVASRGDSFNTLPLLAVGSKRQLNISFKPEVAMGSCYIQLSNYPLPKDGKKWYWTR